MSTTSTVYTSLTLIFLTIAFVRYTKDTVQMRMYPSANSEQMSAQKKEIDLPKRSEKKETNGPVFAVVLLHGYGAPADELAYFANKIDGAFKGSALVIQPTCRARTKSVHQRINHQAKKVFQYIQSEITARNKEPNALPLIIMGYSAGGVVACILGNTYQNQLNICGIFTLNAPLKGLYLFGSNYCKVSNFISKGAEGLKAMVDPNLLPLVKRSMKLFALALPILRLKWFPRYHGLKDLLPDSRCIKEVTQFLRLPNHNITCQLNGSYHDDWLKYFYKKEPNNREAIDQLNPFRDAYTQLIANGKKNDLVVALSSQLCRGERFDDLTLEDIDNPTVNIKRHIYKDKIHCANLPAILKGNIFVDEKDRDAIVVTRADEVFHDLIEFIKKQVKEGTKR